MKAWRKRFQDYWMTTDIKPKGKSKQLVSRLTRRDIKRESQSQIKTSSLYEVYLTSES